MIHIHKYFNYSIVPVFEVDTGGKLAPFKCYIEVCLKCKKARFKIEVKR